MSGDSLLERLRALLSDCADRKPTVPEVLPLVNEFYGIEGNGVGGHLHIVLDDGNIEDDHVAHCLERARMDDDFVAEALASILVKMSRTQRTKLYRRHGPGYTLLLGSE